MQVTRVSYFAKSDPFGIKTVGNATEYAGLKLQRFSRTGLKKSIPFYPSNKIFYFN